MKPSAIRIERMLEEIEARLVPPPRKCLSIIIHEGDDKAMEKALAEHVACHPEDAGRTVKDFRWVVREIVRRQGWRLETVVGAGFVTSLARPGSNTTGFTAFEYGIPNGWSC